MQPPNDPRFEPAHHGTAPAPFRSDVAPAWSAYAQGPAPLQAPGSAAVYGDAAGEYLHMKRGHYTAMVYVGFGFLFQCGFLFAILFSLMAIPFGLMGDERPADEAMMVVLGVAAVGAIAGAWWTFRDRWRCIEAFSSRFCSGLANLSAMYVPAIAWGYANYRAIQKLRGR